ncbi:MAG: hypothetical protein U0V70_09490 [Terriglobia bacterium]
MKKITLLLLLLCLPTVDVASRKISVEGAWLQTGLKWKKSPADVDSTLRDTVAGVLYFGSDKTFAIIYCVVIRRAEGYETISNGDGQVIYRGTWQFQGDDIAIEYRLESRTLPKPGEELPGPIQHAAIKMFSGVLNFEGKAYHRAVALDKSAAVFVYGVRKSSRTRKNRASLGRCSLTTD